MLDRIIETSARDDVLQIDLRELGIDDYGQLSRHGYWKANDVSTTPPMELYVDGEDMTLARWPNAGAAKDTVQMNKIVDPPGPTKDDADLQERGGTFSYSYDRPQYWGEAKDVWLDGIFGQSWEWSYNKIEKIDTDARTITLRYGEMSGLMKTWYPPTSTSRRTCSRSSTRRASTTSTATPGCSTWCRTRRSWPSAGGRRSSRRSTSR